MKRWLDRLLTRGVAGRRAAGNAPSAQAPGTPPPPADPYLPAWRTLKAQDGDFWRERLAVAKSGPKVLIANNVPFFYNSTILESLLAAALTLRGADVHVLQCDKVMPACLNSKFRKNPPQSLVDGSFRKISCEPCVARQSAFLDLGVRVHQYSEYLSAAEREEFRNEASSVPAKDIPSYVMDGLAVGEHAYAGCLRYFSTGNLHGEPLAEPVLRRYFEAALQSARVMGRLVQAIPFETSCFHHGIYIPQGIAGEVLRARGVRVVTWNTAYRKRCFVFSHGDTYHHTLLEEPVSAWQDMRFTDLQDREIQDYLKGRWQGSQDWIYFHDTPDDRLDTLVRETGLDPAKPVIGMLTNVMWDAQLHYRANAFPNMLEWIVKTIRYFEKRPDLQLLIRVHPAELRGLQPSRQFVVDEIKKAFPVMPRNVFVIPPESNVNTYAAMLRCNCVIIYGTKTGVELTSLGVPVIVAGEAWIRNKGLTTDISSEEQYGRVLDGLPLANSRLPESRAREARKYAYHFFLRRMVPIASVDVTNDKKQPFVVSIRSLRELLPGKDEGLDLICDGILKNTPFIYKSEERTGAATA